MNKIITIIIIIIIVMIIINAQPKRETDSNQCRGKKRSEKQ